MALRHKLLDVRQIGFETCYASDWNQGRVTYIKPLIEWMTGEATWAKSIFRQAIIMPSVNKTTEDFFMKAEQYDEVESQIGYDFKNRLLLQQAFTRKSYTQETHDGENNEVLEFIGDKVLDLIVVKVLTEYYGEIDRKSVV